MTTIDHPRLPPGARVAEPGPAQPPPLLCLDRRQLLGLLRLVHTDGRRPVDAIADPVLDRFSRAAIANVGRRVELACPVDVLADLLTIAEHTGTPLSRVRLCHIGDGRTRYVRSLLLAGALLGMDLRVAAPPHLWPDDAVVEQVEDLAVVSGARLLVTVDAGRAASGADVVVAGLWHDEAVLAENGDTPRGFVVNEALLGSTEVPLTLVLLERPDAAAAGSAPRSLALAQVRNRRRVAELLTGARFLN